MIVNCVVVTYNRLSLLKECLSALSEQTYDINKIIIVNNCSTDGTRGYLDQFINNPKYKILNLDQNIGGAGGFSIGLKSSVNDGADYTWIMDDDTIAKKDSLQNLIDVVNNEENVGLVCSKVVWNDNSIHLMNKPGVIEKTKMLYTPKNNSYYKCSYCSFVSVIINSAAVKKVGLPIKEFFIWYDDVEYTTRIHRNGYNCFYYPSSVVVHKTAINYSSSIENAPKEVAERFYYHARNRCYMKRQRKNKIIFFFSLLNQYRVYLHRINKRKDDKAPFLDAVKRGCIDGWRFNPPIEFP